MDPELALEYVHEARAIGKEHDIRPTVAVCDAGGHPVAVVRGRADKWHGPYMAMGKARLAAAFQKPTGDLVERWSSRPMFAASLIEVIPGGVTVNPGGHPIFSGSTCIGAIGVGGGPPDVDGLVARLTVERLAPRLAEREGAE
jgi:uncharacterized protein GlcG (DUF336 family)